LKKLFALTLLLGLILAGCLAQTAQAPSPTPTPQIGDVQSQADSIEIPSIEIPELDIDTGFEDQPVDISG